MEFCQFSGVPPCQELNACKFQDQCVCTSVSSVEPSQTLIKNLDPRVYPVEPVQLPPRNCQPAFIRQAFEMWTILPSFHDEKVKFELSLRLRFQNPKISTILVQRSLQAPIGPIKSVSPNRWTNFIQWDPKSGCNML